MESPKLSRLAQFDDLSRSLKAHFGGDVLESKIKELMQSCEQQRLLWLLEHKVLNETKAEAERLRKDNRILETTLKNVRAAYQKDLTVLERLQSERDTMFGKLVAVQRFLQEDIKVCKTEAKVKVLSSLDLHKLEPVREESNSGSDNSLSDIEFDKTDEDIFGEKSEYEKRLSNAFLKSPLYPSQSVPKNSTELKNDIGDIDSPSTCTPCSKRKSVALLPSQDPSPIKKAMYDNETNELSTKEMMEIDDQFGVDRQKSTPNIKNQSIQSRLSALSQSLIKQRLSKLPLEFKVENQRHDFAKKRMIHPFDKCGPCGKKFGLLNPFYVCRSCRAVCHESCKEKVPMPCIPYLPKSNLGKRGRLVLISDFAQPNCVPCVPALIIHCTAEIERRCLDEIGLYRVPGSEKAVTELRERILKSKTGMPVLSQVDPHILCGVIKSFLQKLDEKLITRLAWREFVKAAMTENEQEKRMYFEESISDLPIANRHTLAYLILHFQRIASSPFCKMTIDNFARVLAPTIVGYSMTNPPAVQMYEENRKSILVMKDLLSIESSYWESIISPNSSYCKSSGESETTESLPSVHQETVIDCRPTKIGSRLYGGRVTTGTLTPLKGASQKTRSKNIKPLF